MTRIMFIILIGVILTFAVCLRVYDDTIDTIEENHAKELKALRNLYGSQTASLAIIVAKAQVGCDRATYLQKNSSGSKIRTKYGYPVCNIEYTPQITEHISIEDTFIDSYNEFLKSTPGHKKTR